VLIDQAFAVSNTYFKNNKKNNYKHYHLLGAGFTCWTVWQISTVLGIDLGSVIPEELGLSFTISLTFLALLINDFRKFRGTNFIYTLKTVSDKLIPVFVHSHHIHQHEVDEKFGIKRPINIDHIVCF
jgi:predicted branched-subunit amino acid permease